MRNNRTILKNKQVLAFASRITGDRRTQPFLKLENYVAGTETIYHPHEVPVGTNTNRRSSERASLKVAAIARRAVPCKRNPAKIKNFLVSSLHFILT
jgi:hypothetical protein